MPVKLPKEFRTAFDEEMRVKTVRAVWALFILASILFPVTIFLDYFVLFGQLEQLAYTRAAATAAQLLFVGLPLIVLSRKGLANRYSRALAWAFILVTSFGIDGLVLASGGPHTPYYQSFAMLMVGLLVSLPWGVVELGLVVVIILLQYDAAMIVFAVRIDAIHLSVANYILLSTGFIGLFWCYTGGHALRVSEFLGRKDTEKAKARSDELLRNILPEEIAEELKTRHKVKARHIESCTIMFTDFVGFTQLARRVSPSELVESLDAAFSRFDDIITDRGMEKLKTIGDAYMCAAGVLQEQPDHLVRCLLAGLEMLAVLESEEVLAADGTPLRMRVGVHPGPVVAGVIGQKKFAFDLWGDTVNTASRLESSGQPGSVTVSTAVFKKVETLFAGVDRGYVPVRGKGPIAMTRVTRLRPEYSKDTAGFLPNERLFASIETWALPSMTHQGDDVRMPTQRSGELALRGTTLDPFRVLSQLTTDDRDVLVRLAEPMVFAPGQALIEQGQSLSTLFLLLEGQVGVRISRDKVSIEVAVLGAGEIVGELSFVSWEPASATVVAHDEVVALRFDLDWIQTVTAHYPQTGVRLFHSLALVLAQRVRESNARLFAWGAERETAQLDRAARRAAVSTRIPPALQEAVSHFRERMQSLERLDGERPRGEMRGAVAKVCHELVGRAAAAARLPAEHGTTFDPGLGAFVLRETFPYFMRSPLMERMHMKPLGSALDHLSAERIHANEARGHTSLGEHVDAWFLGSGLATALRSCMRQIVRLARESRRSWPSEVNPFRVTILSSSLALGWFDALTEPEAPENVRVTCLDSDLSALSALGNRAKEEGFSEQLMFICGNLMDRGTTRGPLRLQPQHFISMPILTEVRDDMDLVALLDEAHEGLLPGGTVSIGFLRLGAEDRFVAGALLEWSVPELTDERLERIVAQSAFAPQRAELVPGREGSGAVMLLRRFRNEPR